MRKKEPNISKRGMLLFGVVLCTLTLVLFYSCNEEQVALDGDYDPSVDSILSTFPSLNPETETITKAEFAHGEILRAVYNRGASNYKFVKSFLIKHKIFGTVWPQPNKNFSPNNFIANNIPENLNEVLTDNSLKLLKLYDTLRKNCLYLANDRVLDNVKTKFGYNWGSKQFKNKVIPHKYDGHPNICQTPFYGMDCSGFVYQAFLLSGLNFGDMPGMFANAEYFSHPSNYTKVLDKYFGCSNCYKVERFDNAKSQDLRAGDIIVFERKSDGKIYHIAICFKNMNFLSGTDSLILMESRGDPSKNCDYNNMKDKGPKITFINEENRLNNLKFHIIRISIK